MLLYLIVPLAGMIWSVTGIRSSVLTSLMRPIRRVAKLPTFDDIRHDTYPSKDKFIQLAVSTMRRCRTRAVSGETLDYINYNLPPLSVTKCAAEAILLAWVRIR